MAQLKFIKATTLPGTLEPDTFYFIENGGYAESYLTTSNGVAKSIGNSSMIQALAGGSGTPELRVEADVTDMVAATLTQNSIIYVIDATGDTTVASGSATYFYNHGGNSSPAGSGGLNGKFIKISETAQINSNTVSWSINDW